MRDDVAILINLSAVLASGLLVAIYIMMQTGAFPDTHFGRNVFPTVGVGAVLVGLVSQFDPSGLAVAVALWLGTIVLAAAYGASLDLWAWLRGDYDRG